MNIAVIGMGYVGTTTALVLAELGWNVIGVDTDERKIKALQQGKMYFYEPGLEELLVKHIDSGRVAFTTDSKGVIEHNELIFICVGTPSFSDGSANLSYIEAVAKDIGRYMNSYKLVVTKSTVPVGTQEQITSWIQEIQEKEGNTQPFDAASNPEFLREGKALSDALHPDRIIIGTESKRASELLRLLYQSAECPIVFTSPRTAELIKYASNAFLAVKISYMNELARLCDKLGIQSKDIAYGMGLDPRIGSQFLRAGIGFGGSCFPKDVSALLKTAELEQEELKIVKAAANVNATQPIYMLNKMKLRLKGLSGKKIAVLGLAFKPDTDDVREAPAMVIMDGLLKAGAFIQAHDPIAELPEAYKKSSVRWYDAAEDAIVGTDAVLICTEWPIYAAINWDELRGQMRQPYLFDGRNMLDPEKMKKLGFYYEGIGGT